MSFLTDRASWIRQLFDRAVDQHAAYARTRGPTEELQRACAGGLGSRTTAELRGLQERLRERVEAVLVENEMNGVTHADLILLKDLYVRCQNELEQRGHRG